MNDIRISKYYRMGQFNDKQKSPRPIFVQVSDPIHKEAITKTVYKLKEKKSPLYNYIKVQYWQDDCERDEDLYELTEQEFKSDLREGNLFIINDTDLDHCYGIP
uniref:Uncharacterized protein n=1 Tax=Magallana gigas TaxID=29159 RepID=A0A8W8I6D1_MAGGI